MCTAFCPAAWKKKSALRDCVHRQWNCSILHIYWIFPLYLVKNKDESTDFIQYCLHHTSFIPSAAYITNLMQHLFSPFILTSFDVQDRSCKLGLEKPFQLHVGKAVMWYETKKILWVSCNKAWDFNIVA